MPIYRGDGGSAETSNNATVNGVAQDAAEAAASASAAATSATAAASSATAAASSATSAATSKTAAETAETNAETSETNAATSATNASASATASGLSATAAASSATAASTSETNAASSATTATTKASEASTSATNAATSESNAATSATNAATSATNASNAQTAAETAQTAAETAQAAAEAAQASIDGFFLGALSSTPTVDGNGDPVTAGDWYFDTTDTQTYIYDGSSWQSINPDLVGDTSPQLGGTLDANGNNIDMGVNVITDSKVGQWDTAYGWGDHSTVGYLTSYTETDTLDSVTGRGATTTNAVTVGNLTSTGIDDNATSTAITIDASENVGIGVTSLTHKLQLPQVSGTSLSFSNDASFTLDGESVAYYGLTYSAPTGKFNMVLSAFSDLVFATNATERMRIDSSGDILATGNAEFQGGTASNAVGTDTSGSTAKLYLGTQIATTGFRGQFAFDRSTDVLTYSNGSNAADARITVDGDGNVLVGTTSEADGYRLVVQGSDQEATGIADTGDHGASILLKATGDAAGSGGSVAFGTTFGNGKPFAAVTGYVRNGADNSAGDLIFANRNSTTDTSLTERVRLRFDGNFGVGTNDPSRKVHFKSAQSIVGLVESTLSSQPATLTFKDVGQTIANGVRIGAFNDTCILQTNGLTRLEVSSTGVIRCPIVYSTVVTGRDVYVSSTGNLGYISSTRESKDNIQSLSDVSWLYNLNPVSFNYRLRNEVGAFTEGTETDTEYGLVAEEVEQVNSELCFYDVDEEGNEVLAGVSYRKLVPALLKAVQEQQAMIETLQAEVAALQAN